MRGRHTAQLLIKPGHIVIGQFLQRVERDNVPAIGFDSGVVQSQHDAVDLALVFRVDLWPENFLRGLAVKIPIAFGLMQQKRFRDAQEIARLFRQQVTVLITNLLRRAFKVNVNPSVAVEAITSLQASIRVSSGGSAGRRF